MKLKHKKLILILSASALGVGLIAFAISNRNPNDKSAENVVNIENVAEASESSDQSEESQAMDTPTTATTQEATPSQVSEATPVPTKAEEFELERDAYEDVNKLIEKYLEAKLDCDEKKLKKYVTDSSYIDIEDIQKKTEFIESYNNIEVYTLPGKGDIDYIAYVYSELKIASISTMAPSLTVFYISNVDGDDKIVLGDVSDETTEYIEEAESSEAVLDLIETVNDKYVEAINSDDSLKEFCQKLDENNE